jgi:uncharacterized membrane protein YqhA
MYITDYWRKVTIWTLVFNSFVFFVIGAFVFEYESWVEAVKMLILLFIAGLLLLITPPFYSMFFKALHPVDKKQQLEELKNRIDEDIKEYV